MDALQIDRLSNTSFDPAVALDEMRDLLIGFVERTQACGLSTSSTDLAALHRVHDAVRALADTYFTFMHVLAATRRANLVRYAGVRLVSIGYDCFSRAVATRWGLKPVAALGERSGPFDLAVHPPHTLIHLLRTNFAGYLDPGSLSYDADHGCCFNHSLGISFNHETGPDYASDGFARLLAI